MFGKILIKRQIKRLKVCNQLNMTKVFEFPETIKINEYEKDDKLDKKCQRRISLKDIQTYFQKIQKSLDSEWKRRTKVDFFINIKTFWHILNTRFFNYFDYFTIDTITNK